VLVSGSCGLIGSEVSLFFARNGFDVIGIDNSSDLRKMKTHFPSWDVSKSLDDIFRELADRSTERMPEATAS